MSRRPTWLDERSDPPLRRAALLPLAAAAALYGLGARTHRAAYRSGLRRAARLPCAVVSVGALSAGGSGKTPVAAALAAGLRARGERVALASRGYGRVGGGEIELVSDGKALRSDVGRAGDEPLLLAAAAPGVPVLVARDRARAGRRAVAEFGTGLLVLDDGFQHHRLARDLDVVVLDGSEGLGNGSVLPRGPLREPPAALRFAHAIAVVDGPLPAADDARVGELAPAAARFIVRRVPRALRRLRDPAAGARATDSLLREPDPLDEPPAALAGREVGLLSGLARPASFRRTVEALGARVVAERCFPDHHPYAARDLAGLAAAAPLWITTEKDAVKIEPEWVGGAELRVLAIDIEGVEPLVEFVSARLREIRSNAGSDA